MRVALFSETYVPEINGVVAHVKLLKEGLEALGHEVLVVTADSEAHRHYVRDGILYCPSKKIKKIYDYGMAMPMDKNRYKYLKEFDPDIIHIHTEFGIGLFGIFTAQMLKKPVVYTIHTIYDEYLYYLVPDKLNLVGRKIFYKYIRAVARKANLIIGPSKKSEEFLKRAGVDREVEIVANGVDTDRFSPENLMSYDRETIRNIYDIPKDAFLGCTITRIGREKSIDILIMYLKEYIRENDKFYLMIVGDGPDKERLKGLAKRLMISDKIIFTGKISNKDIIPYYGASDVFMSASMTEINSISMLESMSMGVPVLQKYDKVNEDQILEGVNGYTFSDRESMKRCLNKIFNMNSDQRLRLKQCTRDSMINHGAVNVAKEIVEKYLLIL